MFGVIISLHVQNFVTGRWLFAEHLEIQIPWLLAMAVFTILWTGSVLTRIVRSWPALIETKKRWWIWVMLYPGYLIMMWVWHLYAILTMNIQGWLTREGGAGGFSS